MTPVRTACPRMVTTITSSLMAYVRVPVQVAL
jgi:hypothetical protein